MSVSLKDLVSYCSGLLNAQKIKDYCPNGLQVEGASEIQKIVGGVTASQALIDEAIARDADVILVHHGYFWRGEAPEVTGIKRNRLKSLLTHNISLLAYHLPIDVHPEFGNNIQLAARLGFSATGPLDPDARPSVGNVGRLEEPMTAAALTQQISERLGRECIHIGDPSATIESIAWCTGAAQGMIEQAVVAGVDAYLSGEISEPTVHVAREAGVHYFSAGHHATERYGVYALGEHLQDVFDVAFEFVDIDNPV
jgi:dinuclear metal center YbgI/SA1388 family protein